MKLTISSE